MRRRIFAMMTAISAADAPCRYYARGLQHSAFTPLRGASVVARLLMRDALLTRYRPTALKTERDVDVRLRRAVIVDVASAAIRSTVIHATPPRMQLFWRRPRYPPLSHRAARCSMSAVRGDKKCRAEVVRYAQRQRHWQRKSAVRRGASAGECRAEKRVQAAF